MIGGTSVPCYSARFIRPFAQVLSTYESFDAESLRKLRAIDPGGRISTTVANDLAVRHVALTRDPDLGLKAARAMPLGGAGALDYAIQSAATVRQSVDVAHRYIRAYSDVLDVHLVEDDSRALITLEMSIAAPRAILDFTMSAWFANHIRPSPAGARGLECWFSHARPASTTEYERAFAGAALRFGAPSYGFAFDHESLEAPLPCANAAVHALLCGHVQGTLDHAAERPTLTGRVREVTSGCEYEIIIVDDGSKDHTSDIVKAFTAKNPRVRLIGHEKNLGYGGALQTGFKSCKYGLDLFRGL